MYRAGRDANLLAANSNTGTVVQRGHARTGRGNSANPCPAAVGPGIRTRNECRHWAASARHESASHQWLNYPAIRTRTRTCGVEAASDKSPATECAARRDRIGRVVLVYWP